MALFTWPIVFEIWNVYLLKFIERYVCRRFFFNIDPVFFYLFFVPLLIFCKTVLIDRWIETKLTVKLFPSFSPSLFLIHHTSQTILSIFLRLFHSKPTGSLYRSIYNSHVLAFLSFGKYSMQGKAKLERARELFEQAVEKVPGKFAKPLYLLYATYEEVCLHVTTLLK